MFPIEQKQFMKMPIEARRELIRAELPALKIVNPDFGYMNNFSANLPGGSRRLMNERIKIMDIPYKDILLEDQVTQVHGEVSDVRWNQTQRDFYAAIDKTIVDLGISMDMIVDLQQRHNETVWKDPELKNKEIRNEAIATLNQLNKLTEPVFIELRALGYSRQDLAG